MREIRSYELAPQAGETPTSLLVHEGNATGRIVAGVVLGAQFATVAGSLLLTTEDIPFEEALHLYLLDESHRVRDHREISQRYSTGTLEKIEVVDEDRIAFDFIERWRLRVTARPRGWRRLLGKGHLHLERL